MLTIRKQNSTYCIDHCEERKKYTFYTPYLSAESSSDTFRLRGAQDLLALGVLDAETIVFDRLAGGVSENCKKKWEVNYVTHEKLSISTKLTVAALERAAVITGFIFSRSLSKGAISHKYSSLRDRNTSPSILCSLIFSKMLSEIIGICFFTYEHTDTQDRDLTHITQYATIVAFRE